MCHIRSSLFDTHICYLRVFQAKLVHSNCTKSAIEFVRITLIWPVLIITTKKNVPSCLTFGHGLYSSFVNGENRLQQSPQCKQFIGILCLVINPTSITVLVPDNVLAMTILSKPLYHPIQRSISCVNLLHKLVYYIVL